ncbi:MAG: methyl-accepting chemotaxis protein [Pseudomonadota bacterium]
MFHKLKKLEHSVGLAMLLIIVITTIAFGLYSYQQQRSDLIDSIDARLITAAYGLKLHSDNYHDQFKSNLSIDATTYLTLLKRQSNFSKSSKINYAYTMMLKDGDIVFTSDSPLDEEYLDESYTHFLDKYEDASDGLKKAINENTIQYDEYSDSWGSFRSIFLPTQSLNGTPYIIGIDIELSSIYSALNLTILKILAIGLGILCFGYVMTIIFTRIIFSPLVQVTYQVKHFAEGDLGSVLNISRADEIGTLTRDINNLGNSLCQLIGQIQTEANKIDETTEVLTQHSVKTSDGVRNQSLQAKNMVDSAKKLATTLTSISNQLTETSSTAVDARDVADEGNKVVLSAVTSFKEVQKSTGDMEVAIENLDKKVSEITKVIILINTIANQTNLLALNASIEAARAGEHGRGFAVVADEVRNLASKTIEATKEIEVAIKAVQMEATQTRQSIKITSNEIGSTAEQIGHVEKAFGQIDTAFSQVTKQVEKIAHAVESQSQDAEKIELEAMSTADISQSIENMTKDVVAKILALKGFSKNLQATTNRFKLK